MQCVVVVAVAESVCSRLLALGCRDPAAGRATHTLSSRAQSLVRPGPRTQSQQCTFRKGQTRVKCGLEMYRGQRGLCWLVHSGFISGYLIMTFRVGRSVINLALLNLEAIQFPGKDTVVNLAGNCRRY